MAAGVCALRGPLHGGANVAVIRQLEQIHRSGSTIEQLIERVKQKRERLFGFGHGVYTSYDPRAAILRKHVRRSSPSWAAAIRSWTLPCGWNKSPGTTTIS